MEATRDAEPPHPAAQAFDLLYALNAPALTRQAYLLCGHHRVAEHAVRYAFHLAWERWPEVAVDQDPTSWVRAAAYEYALSPWHRFRPGRPGHRTHRTPPGPPADRALFDAWMSLPRSYRRALLLHDGLGMSVAKTAAETESSGPAAYGRIFHARESLTALVPELREAPAEQRAGLLRDRLRLLADAQSVRIRPAEAVRTGSEHTTRRRTRASFGLTALVVTAVAATAVTAETRSVDPAEHQWPAPAVAPPSGGEGGGTPEIYAPQLRSSNERVHLDEAGTQDGQGVSEK
ncbi:sigma-70 family RNA polymerase sigma factor [Streptomyces sp. N2-109]|uniref:Sigma-70 family RNA polymerase sigma factor n=1 Tax=Streptomyces gossypii TaxID=2883101 RepID=A0ABT2JWS3_9ACTN|nr:sigma-70 family RNA polymerase sigma factor [Streptomyces gossypii]MCT2592347.1 sigma-70 family RNA polymerase sigma factor [Streptomyces gossypii]